MKLSITKQEQDIFDMVLSCRPANVVPRVAGGWVRDKIMGVASYDLDIALENISGYDFAMILERSFKDSVSSVSIIQSNPDKSKHLETAVCKINGLLIDFVNLRCEKYTDSRIPTITIGTPEEDAFRRDLTINSLFYNLVTREVEDYTGKGVQDIKDKILRTPLDPLTTFSDDPLRILRLFRFKSKLDFEIPVEIFEALKNANLKIHLKNKVSKERVHIEIFKMINNKYGHKGIYEIIRNKYIEAVFGLQVDYEKVEKYYHILESKTMAKVDDNTTDNRWIYNLYIIFLESSTSLVLNKKKVSFSNFIVCRDNLCCSKKISNIIKEIEEGIYLCKYLDFENLSIYNICFIFIVLGNYCLDIIYLTYIKEEKEELMKFLNFIHDEKINIIFQKPKLEIKDIDKKLGIEKKFINFFVKEIQIYQFAYPENDIFEHLTDNKQEIIKKFANLELPYNVKPKE